MGRWLQSCAAALAASKKLILIVGGSVWLKNWAEVNGRSGTNPNVGKYIGIYLALGVGSAALVVVQTLILWIFCSIEVRQLEHGSLGWDK
jgi:hypothetical protein